MAERHKIIIYQIAFNRLAFAPHSSMRCEIVFRWHVILRTSVAIPKYIVPRCGQINSESSLSQTICSKSRGCLDIVFESVALRFICIRRRYTSMRRLIKQQCTAQDATRFSNARAQRFTRITSICSVSSRRKVYVWRKPKMKMFRVCECVCSWDNRPPKSIDTALTLERRTRRQDDTTNFGQLAPVWERVIKCKFRYLSTTKQHQLHAIAWAQTRVTRWK